MSTVSTGNNGSPSPKNGHNGHSVRDMFPETFTLLDLISMRKQNVTVTVNMNSLFDSDYADEEDYYFYGGLAEEERWEDERTFRHEERQHPGMKFLGHGKAHEMKRQVMPRGAYFMRCGLTYISEPWMAEQVMRIEENEKLIRGSVITTFKERGLLPKKERQDWRFKKQNSDGMMARSGEWKRHEVRRDRNLKHKLNDAEVRGVHECLCEEALLNEYGAENLFYLGLELKTEFELQYAEEIAQELRMNQMYAEEHDDQNAFEDDSYFSYDDYLEDELLYDYSYSAEANAAWDEYQAQITPWLRKLPRMKTEEQQDAEYETWFLKRNPVRKEVEVTTDDSPPLPPTGLRKCVTVEQKIPVQTFAGTYRKIELRNRNEPKRRRAEISERKRKEIRDGRKMKSVELAAFTN